MSSKVTNSQVTDDAVVFTIKTKSGEVEYSIPRVFTKEQADLTLAAYLRDLDTPKEEQSTSVEDWGLDALDNDSLKARVDAIEAKRAKEAKEYAKRAAAEIPVIIVKKPTEEREEEMLAAAKEFASEVEPEEE